MILSVLVALASQAQAVWMDFRYGGTYDGPYYGNTRTFTEEGVTVEVRAWAYDRWNDEWNAGHAGRSSNYGLYNINSPDDGSHTIDNQGWIDYIEFKFDHVVELEKAYMYVWGDGDFDYWTSTSGGVAGTGAPTSGGTSVSHESSGYAYLSGTTDYLLIGAEYYNDRVDKKDRDDKFKIKKLHFYKHAGSVPEGGATVAMLGMALLGLAAAKHLKNRP